MAPVLQRNKMITLGIYPGHNAAVCIVKDGVVILNLELERYSRVKHDYGYKPEFVEHCLKLAGLSLADIDLVAINGWGSRGVLEAPPTGNIRHVEFSCKVLSVPVAAVAVNHHLAHVAAAYYTSPFNDATVFTVDGGGDNENGSFARCENGRIEEYIPLSRENIAGWWSGATMNNYRMPRLHAWDPGSGAGKLMALAAYGEHDTTVDEIFAKERLSPSYSETYTDPAGLAFNGDEDLSDTKSKRSQAFARALQDYTEGLIATWFDEAYQKFPADNICYAGGIALNCIANAKALQSSLFKRLHVPPCPNDTGIALGMALYAYHHIGANPYKAKFFSPYTGPEYDLTATLSALRAVGCRDREATPSAVGEAITLGIVAVWRQRSECGPRALGHRSLLTRADSAIARDFMNFEVKKREWYRPYAPIILSEHASQVLDGVTESPYMTSSASIRSEWRERMVAVDHVDHTTRPQVIEREHESFVHAVVSDVYRRTGVPAVLNTSFNRSAPMVETPVEAARLFLELPIKYLVLGDHLLEKP